MRLGVNWRLLIPPNYGRKHSDHTVQRQFVCFLTCFEGIQSFLCYQRPHNSDNITSHFLFLSLSLFSHFLPPSERISSPNDTQMFVTLYFPTTLLFSSFFQGTETRENIIITKESHECNRVYTFSFLLLRCFHIKRGWGKCW